MPQIFKLSQKEQNSVVFYKNYKSDLVADEGFHTPCPQDNDIVKGYVSFTFFLSRTQTQSYVLSSKPPASTKFQGKEFPKVCPRRDKWLQEAYSK